MHRSPHTPVASHSDARGTVVSARETSTAAGLAMYERGGTAVDAAIAAALVAGVIEPTETTLAGSGFMLLHEPGQAPISVEFGPRAPRGARPTMFDLADTREAGVVALSTTVGMKNVNGPLANGVPRTLLGLLTAQRRWGSLPLDVVAAPAVAAAYGGFVADTWFVSSALSDLERLRRNPQAAETFLRDGLPIGALGASDLGLATGRRARVVQPLLGRTLEIATQNPESLVDGEIARDLIATSAESGGILSTQDFLGAQPRVGAPRTLDVLGHQVHTPTSPNGGHTVLQILALWERLTAEDAGATVRDRLRELTLIVRHAFADRYHWLGDPDFVPAPETELLDNRYLDSILDEVARGEDVHGWNEGLPWATFAGRPAHSPWPGAAPVWAPVGATTPTSGTTHVSAADGDGRTVAITHTAAHHFGSGVVCPRTGLLLDAAMAWFNAAPGAANSIEPGKRPLANMAPVLVSQDERPLAALGASGGRRIVSADAQLVIALLSSGDAAPRQRVTDVLGSARFDASGPTIALESGLADLRSRVNDLGAVVVPTTNDPYVMDVARANVAVVGDPTSSGQAADSLRTEPASGISIAAYSH